MIARHPTNASSFGPSKARFDAKSYWETRLRQHPGLCGVGNTRMGKQYIQWLYRVRRTVFLRLLRSLRTDFSRARVFDFGSGTGFYLELWKELGVSSIAGCDLTEIAVSRLRREFPSIRIFEMDISDGLLRSACEEYDFVSAFDVLFHIVEDERYEQAVRNAHALLRPGGLFLFSDLLVHHSPRSDEHVRFRSLSHVEVLLKNAGFAVLRRVPMFVLMEEPLDSRSPVYHFLWRLATYPARKSELAGFLLGALLFPPECFLTKIFDESPTTEIIVCQKRSEGTFEDSRKERA
ncbi:MAG TPA: class I SAM-dependent methyltransferase [Candidatus Bathyarchaeia archaeon]|nr:class I SAM-dependent methyltransferase [Candidatus Bathyarchaeia archaeon]